MGQIDSIAASGSFTPARHLGGCFERIALNNRVLTKRGAI
jgi:hypothetical protein